MTDAIIILGMHRSGTSCLTGCLKSFGLQLGNVIEFSKYNQKGNQEKKEVFRLNEAILNFNKKSWDNPPTNIKLKIEDKFLLQIDEIINGFSSLPKPWGLKDPRMLLTYEVWKQKLPDHRFIGTLRHPAAVVNSLAARDRLSVPAKQGFKLWYFYNEKLLKYREIFGFPIVNFDLPQHEYLEKIKKAAKILSLNHQVEPAFFDSNLIHQKADDTIAVPDYCVPLYNRLLNLCI